MLLGPNPCRDLSVLKEALDGPGRENGQQHALSKATDVRIQPKKETV